MTTSERVLRTIALRLAIILALAFAGHLPDQRHSVLIAPAGATDISAACVPGAMQDRADAATLDSD